MQQQGIYQRPLALPRAWRCETGRRAGAQSAMIAGENTANSPRFNVTEQGMSIPSTALKQLAAAVPVACLGRVPDATGAPATGATARELAAGAGTDSAPDGFGVAPGRFGQRSNRSPATNCPIGIAMRNSASGRTGAPSASRRWATGMHRKCISSTVPITNSSVKHYGHPSKAGFKDVIHSWKADQWDPGVSHRPV